jgi:hypothetical protein
LRAVAGTLALVAGVALVTVSIWPSPGAARPDPATAAGAARQASSTRVAHAWHTAPVDVLFPAMLVVDDQDPPLVLDRLGVAPAAECADALDPTLVEAAGAPCARVLRATYVDPTRTVVATAGIVVLDRVPRNRAPVSELDGDAVKLMHPYRVAGTEAAGFGDRQRITSGIAVLWQELDAPYLVTIVVGAADGRAPSRLPKPFDTERQRDADRAEWRALGDATVAALVERLGLVIRASRTGATW